MPQLINTGAFYQGGTRSPLREFIASLALGGDFTRVIVPCAGRFNAVQAIVQAGYPVDQVTAADISLPASLVGYLCDPTKRVADLGIDLNGERLHDFIAEAEDEFDWAAGILLAVQFANIRVKSAHDLSIKAELHHSRNGYRQRYRKALIAMVTRLRGIHYEIADISQSIPDALSDPNAFIYINPVNYWTGLADPFEAQCAEGSIVWRLGKASTYIKKEYDTWIKTLNGEATIVVFHASTHTPPANWIPVSATQAAEAKIDYLLANHDPGERYARQNMDHRPIKHYEIYADQEIRPDSVITFIPVGGQTALYYRDLFVHRLGSTDARFFLLFLIDGRVVGTCGMHDERFLLGQSPYILHTFGITRTSTRYARLGKLLMLCLTSGQFRDYLLTNGIRPYSLLNPLGLQTTTIAEHEEGKTDRSIMKMINREALPHGTGYRIVYQADFRKDTWADCLTLFLKKWGNQSRPSKADPALPILATADTE